MQKNRDLTSGSITGGLWAFAVPLMLGNVLQQFYNLADTWVVGKYIGDQRAGCGRLVVYAHDVPDLGYNRFIAGNRLVYINGVWQKRAGLHTQWHIHVSGDNRNTYIADNRRILHAY